ncbi:Lrp/AsnC family transcriptional regulator [Haloterrigena salinisoli]|uniref:Lrp/AsnC family transcriptional regulator n=1 Tax=Haloterrigena salinisoli TaxID=3132747 RepID=UPI00387E276E
MGSSELDDRNRQILHLLQQNARSISTENIGRQIGIAALTVRNRLKKMEGAGIIRGYHPEIDYDNWCIEIDLTRSGLAFDENGRHPPRTLSLEGSSNRREMRSVRVTEVQSMWPSRRS